MVIRQEGNRAFEEALETQEERGEDRMISSFSIGEIVIAAIIITNCIIQITAFCRLGSNARR